jgi:2-keto-4-pentenoate hydratase/2-oxohepta-3-ene-1,7-dioic acid hydratase in catechol pathway
MSSDECGFMKLARTTDGRVGLVRGAAGAETFHDATAIRERLPALRWPLPPGDQLVASLPGLRAELERLAGAASPVPAAGLAFASPVANPSKIVGAPINYVEHAEESRRDPGISHGRRITGIADMGLFLKAPSALVGPGEGVALRMPERRNDHEVELAVVIGRPGTRIAEADALGHVAGYAIGLDMTVRGTELPSFRKSVDSYAVLGPWLVTADEIPDPGNLRLRLSVNGETRQDSSTAKLDFGVAKLIAYASSMYTLHPGDVIMTGTPAGVGPVRPGDAMDCEIERIGSMRVAVRAA